jgi:hypothetical protein
MSTLADPKVRAECGERIRRLKPNADAKWGRMTARQMVCHLNDSFRVGIGEKYASPATSLVQRTFIKWVALRTPVKMAAGSAHQAGDRTGPWRNAARGMGARLRGAAGFAGCFRGTADIRRASCVRKDERARLADVGVSARGSSFAAIWRLNQCRRFTDGTYLKYNVAEVFTK